MKNRASDDRAGQEKRPWWSFFPAISVIESVNTPAETPSNANGRDIEIVQETDALVHAPSDASEATDTLLGPATQNGVEVDPEMEHIKAPTSPPPYETPKLVATIVKSFIGSGVLFLPKAFENGGWLFSVLVMAFMALISTLCILRLVRCREKVIGSYGFVGFKAVGRWGQIAVDTSLVLSQAGFCCVYVIFIAKNVLQLLNTHTCWIGAEWLWLLILFQWPLFTPLTWVRRIAYFAYTNLIADGIIAAGLTGIIAWSIYGITHSEHSVSLALFNPRDFALFLGTGIYAFEGIGMVVPVYDSLSPPAQRAFPRTLTLTLVGVAVVYILIGLVPYAFVSGTGDVGPMQDAITLNLPRVWWSFLIQAAYCLALIFSYPLMLFPALKILEKSVTPRFLRPRVTRWRKNWFRSFVVAVTLLVSYVGSTQLNNFVALVGCFCCTPLAFIYPCWFHLKLVKAGWVSKAIDVAIIIFGIAVFVFSTYQAIDTWSVSDISPCTSR